MSRKVNNLNDFEELKERKYGPGHGGNRDGKRAAQEAVLAVWLEHPYWSYNQIAKEAGIGSRTFWNYRQEPEFMERVHASMQKTFNALEVKAVSNLERLIENEDWQATKYVLDNRDYGAQQKVAVESNNVTITIDE